MTSVESRATDRLAADMILLYLEERGWSPEAFSAATFNAGHGYVSSRTIYRIVDDAHVPELRVRGVIARQMEKSPRAIWRNAPVVAGRKITSRKVPA